MTDTEQQRWDALADSVLRVLASEEANVKEMRYVLGMILHDTEKCSDTARLTTKALFKCPNCGAEKIAKAVVRGKRTTRFVNVMCKCGETMDFFKWVEYIGTVEYW